MSDEKIRNQYFQSKETIIRKTHHKPPTYSTMTHLIYQLKLSESLTYQSPKSESNFPAQQIRIQEPCPALPCTALHCTPFALELAASR